MKIFLVIFNATFEDSDKLSILLGETKRVKHIGNLKSLNFDNSKNNSEVEIKGETLLAASNHLSEKADLKGSLNKEKHIYLNPICEIISFMKSKLFNKEF